MQPLATLKQGTLSKLSQDSVLTKNSNHANNKNEADISPMTINGTAFEASPKTKKSDPKDSRLESKFLEDNSTIVNSQNGDDNNTRNQSNEK